MKLKDRIKNANIFCHALEEELHYIGYIVKEALKPIYPDLNYELLEDKTIYLHSLKHASKSIDDEVNKMPLEFALSSIFQRIIDEVTSPCFRMNCCIRFMSNIYITTSEYEKIAQILLKEVQDDKA